MQKLVHFYFIYNVLNDIFSKFGFSKKKILKNYKLKQTDPKEYSNGNPYH